MDERWKGDSRDTVDPSAQTSGRFWAEPIDNSYRPMPCDKWYAMVIIAPEALPPSKEIIAAFNFCLPAFSLSDFSRAASRMSNLSMRKSCLAIRLRAKASARAAHHCEVRVQRDQAQLFGVLAALIGQLRWIEARCWSCCLDATDSGIIKFPAS